MNEVYVVNVLTVTSCGHVFIDCIGVTDNEEESYDCMNSVIDKYTQKEKGYVVDEEYLDGDFTCVLFYEHQDNWDAYKQVFIFRRKLDEWEGK